MFLPACMKTMLNASTVAIGQARGRRMAKARKKIITLPQWPVVAHGAASAWWQQRLLHRPWIESAKAAIGRSLQLRHQRRDDAVIALQRRRRAGGIDLDGPHLRLRGDARQIAPPPVAGIAPPLHAVADVRLRYESKHVG